MMAEAVPFLLLGLVLTIGYVIWRAGARGRGASRKAASMEAILREAEREARASARKQEELLALSPEKQYEQQRIRRMTEQNDGEGTQTKDAPAEPPTNRPE